MRKTVPPAVRFESLGDIHRAFGLPQPLHPLISLIDGSDPNMPMVRPEGSHVLHFYKISYKPRLASRLKYGQGYYDFQEGGLLFAAPGQIVGAGDVDAGDCSMFTLLIHPDFLLAYPLAKKIKQYGFFSYATHEALHLSDDEKETMLTLFRIIQKELAGRIDDFSHDVVISQLELFLNYANRFYKRQFITRKVVHSDLLERFETLLDGCFETDAIERHGLPTVQYLSEQLHYSPSYLSDLLRALTGQNTQQHIHAKLIEKAKEKLSTTKLTVSEVAYALGFEHPQSFSKLFKTKVRISPVEFRRSFH